MHDKVNRSEHLSGRMVPLIARAAEIREVLAANARRQREIRRRQRKEKCLYGIMCAGLLPVKCLDMSPCDPVDGWVDHQLMCAHVWIAFQFRVIGALLYHLFLIIISFFVGLFFVGVLICCCCCLGPYIGAFLVSNATHLHAACCEHGCQ